MQDGFRHSVSKTRVNALFSVSKTRVNALFAQPILRSLSDAR
jgi:hypothetical protein